MKVVDVHEMVLRYQDRVVTTSILRTVWFHLRKHVGMGIICAVGYFDPGNWSVDIQAGTTFGYRPMLFVILLAGLMAIVLQVLATRLGCVTGLDLAAHCRILLHDHPRHPRLVRHFVLYPLYVLCEIAIISTDLAELLGSAIGLSLLFPNLPLWAGVLLTGVDVFIFLIIGDPSRTGRPVRLFEVVIILLVAVVFICFIILLVQANPDWPQVFLGFLPSSELLQTQPNAVYTAIGIIGATVMPHALFLGSNLSTQDRVTSAPTDLPPPAMSQSFSLQSKIRQLCRTMFYFSRTGHDDLKDRTTPHLTHGTVDVVVSLLAVAVPINAAILMLAATVFYTPDGSASTGLSNMHTLIAQTLGNGAALVFSLALICSGQTASVTATLAGQIPFLRRLLTRLLSLIPSMIVAIAYGPSGINTLLVTSQVSLSVVLPFVAFPLIYLTSSTTVMSVRVLTPVLLQMDDQTHTTDGTRPLTPSKIPLESNEIVGIAALEKPSILSTTQTESDIIDFSNNYIVSALAYAIWIVILIANIYAIVMLGRGNT
ncbi:natural resistance-associated macrophage protein-domain-containing protein [Melanogaster broomeanus]|nr:natural resistance-associated macrophage protein-domain-containing protein [Melanogaster broomeanus]